MLSLITYRPLTAPFSHRVNQPSSENTGMRKNLSNNFLLYDLQKSIMNKSFVSFKGYEGDIHPLKKMFKILTNGREYVYEDNETKKFLMTDRAGYRKWVNRPPADLLKRTPEQAIQSICTIIKPPFQYPGIRDEINSPNYGSNWGRHANYIEINPRAIAKYYTDKDGVKRVDEGLYSVMKLMVGIPPSGKHFANCLVLSQLYPSNYGDGTINNDSLYCMDLHRGISKNLTSPGMIGKMGEDEQVKAFNDAAHLLGFKTGFRMPLSAGQLRVQGRPFNWNEHKKAFIDACVWGIELGFDCIYFDSARHIIEKDGYCGIGDLPSYDQMRDITYCIRDWSHNPNVSLVGEKCEGDTKFQELGLTAGTDWSYPDDFNHVKYETKNQKWSRNYAAGPEVSNDNDNGAVFFEQRINRIKSCLFGYDYVEDKLPTYMQMHDIFPLTPIPSYVNTHYLMEHTKQFSSDAWTEPERHWEGVFNSSEAANNYRNAVFHEFSEALDR